MIVPCQIQECLWHSCCEVHVMHRMTYSSVHLCNPPEAISDGRLNPATDTSLLLAAYRGGSPLTSDIKIFPVNTDFHIPHLKFCFVKGAPHTSLSAFPEILCTLAAFFCLCYAYCMMFGAKDPLLQ